MGSKKKQSLSKKSPVPSKGAERPWWRMTDAELIEDRVRHFKKLYEDSKVEVGNKDRDALIEEAVRRDDRIKNLLDTVPRPVENVGRDGDFLTMPVYRSKMGEKVGRSLGLKTTRRIRLDRYGWGVWDAIDGERSVEDIGELLRSRFGQDIEPLYPRLSRFLAYLEALELVRIEVRDRGS